MTEVETAPARSAPDPSVFQESKAYLRGVHGGGTSVYDHLTAVLVKVLDEKPPDANGLFEEVSSAVRDATVTEAPAPPTEEQLAEIGDVGTEHARRALLGWARERTPLFTAPAAELTPEVAFPDLIDESKLWAWGGVSLGEITTVLLQMGLKALAVELKTKVRFWGKIATRGKGDYYIAETLTKVNPSVGRDQRLLMEGKEGPNKYTYYVSTAPGGTDSWTQLPHVTVQQMAVVQKVRRYFTGELDAPVACYPPFLKTPPPATAATPPAEEAGAAAGATGAAPTSPPEEGGGVGGGAEEEGVGGGAEGAAPASPAAAAAAAAKKQQQPKKKKKVVPGVGAGLGCEANLLAATVGRITADTKLALAGSLEAESDEAEGGEGVEFQVIKPSDAPDAVTLDALKDPSTFVHAELDINLAGRCQASVYPLNAEGEPMEPEEPDAEPQPPLRPITDDTRNLHMAEAGLLADLALENKGLWQLKGGEGQVRVAPSGPATEDGAGKAESQHSVAIVRSLKWPGAVTVAKEGKTLVNVYVGYGVPTPALRDKPYEPPMPAKVCDTWKDPNAEEDADPTAGMTEEADVVFEPPKDEDEDA